MTIKPEYSKYRQRLFIGFLRVILFSIIWTVLLLLNDLGKVGTSIVGGICGTLSLILIISVFRKSKEYLAEIRFDGDYFEFEMFEYDKPKEIIKANISDTRIKMWEIFFPFTKFGRNYKLIIETKHGLTYERIIQQYEIGNWTLEEFKKVILLYGETKGVSASIASFTRDNISTNK